MYRCSVSYKKITESFFEIPYSSQCCFFKKKSNRLANLDSSLYIIVALEFVQDLIDLKFSILQTNEILQSILWTPQGVRKQLIYHGYYILLIHSVLISLNKIDDNFQNQKPNFFSFKTPLRYCWKDLISSTHRQQRVYSVGSCLLSMRLLDEPHLTRKAPGLPILLRALLESFDIL